MRFQHAPDIWRDFPTLVPGLLFIGGIGPDVEVDRQVERFTAIAGQRLAETTEGELPEIQAWRRAFAKMGLKPTQYRCAAESLLRRYRKEGALPRLHPLVDLCNAVSIAYAIPIAALDLSRITGNLEVRRATGDERYETFSGDVEHPARDEVIFADDVGHAHARRWCNRQSGRSAVHEATSSVVIIAEAMHETAPSDIARLVDDLAAELATVWAVAPMTGILSAGAPSFET